MRARLHSPYNPFVFRVQSFTKYIPVSLYDLQRWLGGPSVYVIDCQNAGRVLKLFEYFCQRRQTEVSAQLLLIIFISRHARFAM